MSVILKKILLLSAIAVLGAFLFPAGALAESRPLIAVSDPFPPFVIGEEGSEATGGVFVERAKKVFDEMGIDVKIELYPWKRCLEMAKNGEAAFMLGVIYTPSRTFLKYPKTPLVTDNITTFYSLKAFPDGLDIKSFADLKGKRVGIVDGYTYGDEFNKLSDDGAIKVDMAKNEITNFKKLNIGRMPVFLCYETSGKAALESDPTFSETIRITESHLTAVDFFLAVCVNNPDAMKRVEALEEALEKTGK